MRITLVGAGRLATQLAPALVAAGHELTAVFSRTKASAAVLAERVGCRATDSIGDLPTEADACVMAVTDAALPALIPAVAERCRHQLLLHTAGSVPLDIFRGAASRYGVLYPMQTFSKDRPVAFTDIPTFIEASDAQSLLLVRTLAESVSQRVYELPSERRRFLHLAAVFACNFANHCYALAADLLEQNGLPFDVMFPLINETARKVHHLHPRDAQTGPAVRYDQNVIAMQTALLADRPDMQALYEQMSLSIHRTTSTDS